MILRILLFTIISFVVVFSLVVVLQNYLIFPAMLNPFKNEAPNEVEVINLKGQDNQKIMLWRYEKKEVRKDNNKKVAILFHGNGELNFQFLEVQKEIAKAGYITYLMEYRGFGFKNGFASENNIYKDCVESISYITKRENIDPKEILPIGYSIGSGFATFVAEKYETKNLVLIAPYTSIPEAAKVRWYAKPIPPFFIYTKLLNKERIKSLKDTKIIDFHGTSDTIVPYFMSEELKKSYAGNKEYILITKERRNHFNIIDDFKREFAKYEKELKE